MSSPVTERTVDTNGIQLRVTEAGDRGAPVVVLAHGFPELGYSWRHQIPVLADAGYHVLAPDQRGYGGSSAPPDVGAYTMAALSADLVGLLDDADAERGVFVGHGFGAPVVWTAAQLHRDRVAAVVGMSVPPEPRSQLPPTTAFRNAFGDNFFYMLYFQQPGVADADLDADAAKTMRRMLCGSTATDDPAVVLRMISPGPEGFVERLPEPGGLPNWMSQRELDHYIATFTRTGFTGALNWYRNLDRNWELAAATRQTIDAPALFIAGTADPVLSYLSREHIQEFFSGDFRQVMIEGAGHWLQQERPDEINRLLLEFLTGLELT